MKLETEKPTPNYYVVIPANVMFDNELIPQAKLLFGLIGSLSNMKGHCWATNTYFAEQFNSDDRTIRRWLTSLKDRGHITVTFVDEKRQIKINNVPGKAVKTAGV